MTKAKVSIIIPVYNTEKYLKRCLDSISSQTYKNLEIILVNDGSTDNSYDICISYQKKDSRYNIINKSNGGVSSARNEGIKIASGEYICFFDSDDEIEHNMIEKLLKNFIDYNVDLSICDYNILNNKIKKKSQIKSFLISSKEEYHKNYKIYQGYLWNKMFKTSIVKQISFDNDIHCCEDELFITKYVEFCKTFFYDNTKLYNYYIRSNSSSGTQKINKRQVTKIIARERELEILKKYDFDIYKDYYISHFLAMNDIYHRYEYHIVEKKQLNKMYKELLYNKSLGCSFKISIFIRYRLFWFYYYLKLIIVLKKG